MMNYIVRPIPAEVVAAARETLFSPQYKSLRADVSIANGYGPCRSCLRVFDQGNERRLYFTYNSFDGRSDLPDPGPVFIHHERCQPFEESGIPPDLLRLPVFFEAYGDDSNLLTRQRMDPPASDSQISSIFADDRVRFINMRNAEAGCFIATIDRASS
jgi:hypothetical protein